METFYIVIIGVLFLLAISDLVVGVSNDAVNFLNSAIGAKATSFKVIMIVAALGILFGATFSSGMMEVARKGIFHPQEFFFSEMGPFADDEGIPPTIRNAEPCYEISAWIRRAIPFVFVTALYSINRSSAPGAR